MLFTKTLRHTRSVRLSLVASVIAISALSACSTYNSFGRDIATAVTPYKIDVVQGNFVSREAAAQLREGMTREQVRYWIGTPLLADIFHANRWDYIFTIKRGGSEVVQQRRYTVFFENDRVVKFGGDPLPSEYELINEMDGIKTKK